MKLLTDLDVADKRVFLRADLDVPLGSDEQATRLTNLKTTVDWLLEHGARQIIIAGHIGRPEGFDQALSTAQLEAPLEAILKRSVTLKPDFSTDQTLASMAQLILFENLRFWQGEEKNSLDFAKQLAELADIYVNESFATCHRAHASMVALPALLPHGAGLHLQKEVEVLSKLLASPHRPFVAVVGGAKIETKVPVIENLAKVADWVLIGGELPIEIVKNGSKYPQNVVIATLADSQKDVANSSIIKIIELIKDAKTVVWNGPMGLFEEGFEAGTMAVAEAILASGAYSVVGGGETTQFLCMKGLLGKFSFVSSGGGAMLEFLAGKQLPGLVALE